MIDNRVEESRRNVWRGRVERLINQGYTVQEITVSLLLPEETVRMYKAEIDAKNASKTE